MTARPPIRYRFLRQARVQRGISARELAEHVGCSPAVVYDYENGRTNPPPDLVPMMARALRVPLHTLTGTLRRVVRR